MTFKIEMIEAKTHSAEYLLHKYWARKPHNVISHFLSKLVPENGYVLDPFSGSGVTLREAGLLGIESVGIDLNPIATLISLVLVDPPNVKEFEKLMLGMIKEIKNKLEYLYKTSEGDTIRYISHRIITKCTCGIIIKQSDAIMKNRSTFQCPNCGSVVRFNLENMYGTEIFNIVTIEKGEINLTKEEVEFQKNISSHAITRDTYDFEFEKNGRILSFEGIKTSSFFTKRNFYVLSTFFDQAHLIEDKRLKNAALSLLTASVAQCSNLIAHRNNMKTGGPAWSIPGFWVPKEHLETNPFIHIEARLKKFLRGLSMLEKKPVKKIPLILNGSSLDLLSSKDFVEGRKFDLIFLDPPYGDSVPYLEFSAIWNSFLKEKPEISKDISVSDRIPKKESWNFYYKSLKQYMSLFTEIIKEDGKLLITFNNKDLRAWKALISALQINNFLCKAVIYQIPAVISSKAQKSLKTSYISDIYSIFELNKEETTNNNLSSLIQDLIRIASIRDFKVNESIIEREFILSFLKNNISVDLLEEKENIIDSLFTFDTNSKIYVLNEEYRKTTVNLSNIIKEKIDKLLHDGPAIVKECYLEIAIQIQNITTIEFYEFQSYLNEYLVKDGKIMGKLPN